MKTKPKESKMCPVCLRHFTNRKSWKSRNIWEQVVYCSERCKQNR